MATITLAAATSGCDIQNLRDTFAPRSAAQAALETVSLDPSDAAAGKHGPSAYLGPRHPAWWAGNADGIPPELSAGDDDVWARIRAGMRLPHVGDGRVKAELQWFVARQEYLDRTAERGRPYLPYIAEQVAAPPSSRAPPIPCVPSLSSRVYLPAVRTRAAHALYIQLLSLSRLFASPRARSPSPLSRSLPLPQ